MNINAFVFSNNRSYRLSRHALFWLVWIFYYAIMSAFLMSPRFGFSKAFIASFTEIAESTPLDMCFCYFIIYYLLPSFLFKGRYISMLLLWLSASILFIFLYEVNSMTIVPYIREWFGTSTGIPATHNYYWDFFTLFSQINMEGCVAASIKLGKLWYVKQQEIDILKHEKEKTLPADRDDLIQPAFLVDLLKRIESLASRDPQLASACINKIRNLIVYILYETAAPQVLVEKEIDILKQYIDLEKLTSGKILQVDTSIEGVEGSETIVPFIILPLVENAFKQVALYPIQNPWVHLQIRVQQSNLNIYLSWSKPVDTSSLINGRNVILRNLSKRLRLIYPQSHKLSMSIKADNVTVALNMDLKKAIK